MDPRHKAEGVALFVFNKTFFLLPDRLPRLLFIHFPGLQSVAGLTDTNLDPPVGSEGIRRGANHRGRYLTPHETGPATGGGAMILLTLPSWCRGRVAWLSGIVAPEGGARRP